jgi:hypothetical protein
LLSTILLLQFTSGRAPDKSRLRHDSLGSTHSANGFINDAFSFLQTQDYSAYKHYAAHDDDRIDVLDTPAPTNGVNTNNNARNNVYVVSTDIPSAASGRNGAPAPLYSPKEYGHDDDGSRPCCSKRRAVACILVILTLLVLAAIVFVALYVIGEILFHR